MKLQFTKMNGAGNDFVMLDNRNGAIDLGREDLARLCDRHRGVGADGVLLVERGAEGMRMRYFNADGGEASMCGNGARCFARYAARLEGENESLSFVTGAGVIHAKLDGENVSLNMSNPHSWQDARRLKLGSGERDVWSVDTGVPHAVTFVENLEALDVAAEGAAIRWHAAFAPNGTNANFVRVESPGHLAIRTYERGVEAETLACGTGVCAAALVHAHASGISGPVEVRVRGGDTLTVFFTRKGADFRDVVLHGPADFVFDGEISL